MQESRKNRETEAPAATAKVERKAVCYVDGSFNPEAGKYAYGCILIHDDGSIEEYCGSGDREDALLQRNVAGEMIGSMFAVRLALIRGYTKLLICYDYSGIECWVTGAWKTKNDLTKSYRDWMRGKMEDIEISFKKVEAHSNDKYNDMADKLAKQGLLKEPGLPEINVDMKK